MVCLCLWVCLCVCVVCTRALVCVCVCVLAPSNIIWNKISIIVFEVVRKGKWMFLSQRWVCRSFWLICCPVVLVCGNCECTFKLFTCAFSEFKPVLVSVKQMKVPTTVDSMNWKRCWPTKVAPAPVDTMWPGCAGREVCALLCICVPSLTQTDVAMSGCRGHLDQRGEDFVKIIKSVILPLLFQSLVLSLMVLSLSTQAFKWYKCPKIPSMLHFGCFCKTQIASMA